MMACAETWLPIAGFEGFYEVSNVGRVRSLERKRSDGRRVNPRVLSLSRHRDGHMRAALSRDGKTCHHFVHRLVLQAFVGPCPEGMQGCHNNGNPSGNCLSNLRWDTCKANHADKKKHGTTIHGERNGRAKLTESDVRHLYELRKRGLKYKEIAKQTGVSWAYVWNILHGKSWTHIHAEVR